MSWNPQGPGWLPPPKPIDASTALIGGGKQAPSGGVPSFASPRGDDTTALTHAVWKEIVEGRFDPSSMASGSNSRLGGLTTASSYDGNMTLGTNPSQYDFTSNAFLCRPLSVCEPCPAESRNHPFCRPYGNRRLVACRVLQGGSPRSRATHDDEEEVGSSELDLGLSLETTQLDDRATNRRPPPPPTMEFQGWEACGKVVKRETRDYLEFVMILLLLALFGLMMLLRRNRHLTLKIQSGQLSSSGASTGSGLLAAAGATPRRRRARLG